MARCIGLVQVKGGAGRSTIATNLAGELAREHRVALIDCDMPQGTSASWSALREQDGLTSVTAANHRELVERVEQFRGHDYLILDGPPRIAEMIRAVLVLADLTLIPIGASAAEVWSTQDMLALIDEAAKTRKLDVRIVWTRFRAYTLLAQELSAAADKALKLRMLKTRLGYRTAYAEALGSGRTVTELADPLARAELLALVAEVQKILR